jgi:hypothetical protein
VLPFVDASHDAEGDYFSLGLNEDVIAELGRLDPDRLAVVARTTVDEYARNGHGIAEAPADQRAHRLGGGSPPLRVGERVFAQPLGSRELSLLLARGQRVGRASTLLERRRGRA